MIRKLVSSASLLAVIVIVPACEKGGVVDPKDPTVATIEATAASLDIEPGDTARFSVTALTKSGQPAARVTLRAEASAGAAFVSSTDEQGAATVSWALPGGTNSATLKIRAGTGDASVTLEGRSVYSEPYLTGVSALVPGETATLKGRGFTGRLASVTAGGRTVTASVTSDSTATIPVPVWSSCDVDARPVEIRAGSKAYSRTMGRVQVKDPFRLAEVGDSKVIPLSELGCLRFPANDESYLVTALNLSAVWGTGEHVFTLRALSDTASLPTGAAPAAARAAAPARMASAASAHEHPEIRTLSKARAAAEVKPLDPRYATAQVGDTLTFIDWYGEPREDHCFTPRSGMRTFQAVVIAAEGRSVFVADTRSTHIAAITSLGERARFQKAAKMVDRTMVAAIRHTINPAFEPRKDGANGRVFTVVGLIPSGWNAAGLITPDHLPEVCTGASGMMTSYHNHIYWKYGPEDLSSIAVHEFAHAAQSEYAVRNDNRQSVGYFYESFAVQAQEAAARFSMGRLEGAPVNELTEEHPDPQHALKVLAWNNVHPLHPIWGFWGRDSSANYQHGGRWLLWARDELGQTLVETPGRTLYQQILDSKPGNEGPDIRTLAGYVNPQMSMEQMLEKFMLDWTLDDQLPASAMQKLGMDGVAAWDNSGRLNSSDWSRHYNNSLRRDGTTYPTIAVHAGLREVKIAPSSWQQWILPAMDNRGLSLLFTDVNTAANVRVRVIRVR